MKFRKNVIESKRLTIAGALGCVAISLPLLLAACGDDSSSGSANNGDETAEDFMFTLEELEEMRLQNWIWNPPCSSALARR